MLALLDKSNPCDFPPPTQALEEPNGLLAVGGDLSIERLKSAYQQGIFPWYSDGEPILWWSPDPRCIILPTEIHLSKSLKKTLRRQNFTITVDQSFAQVISLCAHTRLNTTGTWIMPEMIDAYTNMHRHGIAHSVEIWLNQQLVGGLYGIATGQVFCGESMFSLVEDASKTALLALGTFLDAWQFKMIDCQMPTAHLLSMGAHAISRDDFLALLQPLTQKTPSQSSWNIDALTSQQLLATLTIHAR